MNKTILIILGMHRSGTSVSTRLFNLLGTDPGTNLMQPAEDNPTGFWEPTDIVAVHDELLQKLGSSWQDPNPLPNTWWNQADIKPFEEQLYKLAQQHYTDIEQPIIKDPRLCRLLPIWQKILKRLKWNHNYILVGRSPIEVADSLKKRNELSANHSYLLWLRHVLESEEWSRAHPRIFLMYDQLLLNWEKEITRCSRTLTDLTLNFSSHTLNKINKFIDPTLRHHHAIDNTLTHDPKLSQLVTKTCKIFQKAALENSLPNKIEDDFNLIQSELASTDNLYSALWHSQSYSKIRNKKDKPDKITVQEGKDYNALKNENIMIKSKIKETEAKHASKLKETEAKHASKLKETEAKHASKLKETEAKHASKLKETEAKHASKLKETEAELQHKITKLNHELKQKTLENKELDNLHLQTSSQLQDVETTLKNLNKSMKKIENKANTYAQLLAQRELEALNGRAHIDHLEHTSKRHQEHILKLEQVIKKLHTSKSWSITRPLRALKKKSKHATLSVSNTLINLGRRMYHKTPLKPANKLALRNTVFRFLPKLFNRTSEFKHWQSWQPLPEKTNTPIPDDHIKKLRKTNVSIIIPVYNNWGYTEKCLQSIRNHPSFCQIEVIVVDDCSTDETPQQIHNFPEAVYIKNDINSGFIESCNNGASKAHGDYVFFLNNDTTVTTGWLDELALTFISFPNTGLVGSKLIYPDGSLQEAGGIMWSDGSAWNYGRNGDPERPEFNYMREVDYISGAAIMVPKALFDEFNGFDCHYKPAYCEDSDLALKIRSNGKSVLYQPLSVIVHHEGVSSGTDLTSGIKSYQITNSQKLFKRWQAQLSSHRPNGIEPYLERDRQCDLRILVIDASTPEPDKDAGSITAYHFMQCMVKSGHRVTFIPADNFAHLNHYTSNLQRIGVECIYSPYYRNVKEYLEGFGKHLDTVFLYRVTYASQYIALVKELCPNARIVFNTVDLHYLREERQAEIENSASLLKKAKETKKLELSVMQQSDATIVLSNTEKEILVEEISDANIQVIPLILDIPGRKNPFQKRENILFIGGFRHTPNVDAILYFIEDIWPLIKEKRPSLKLTIIGSHPPDELLNIKADGIDVVGFVEDISNYFDTALLSIVPLRYGAGIKGKVGTSLSYGVPVIATSIATEGMGLKDNINVLVANESQEFAQKTLDLLKNETLWNALSDAGLSFVHDEYSISTGQRKLISLLDELR
ncbi:MAG: glycosyltransferase [Gammaproteobacteria bacterium]|nr:glycosyltransferase [Gammaproteobacteria bacterium]